MGVLLAFLVFGLLIVLHEMGHMVVAKLFGVAVKRFSVGFGKVLVSRKWGETEYCISAIPFGGYVMFPDDEKEAAEFDRNRFLRSQSAPKRFAIMAAGPLANAVTALAFYIGTFLFFGFPHLTNNIGSVAPGSPAQIAGLQSGDYVVAINDRLVERWEDITGYIQEYAPQGPVRITFNRGSELGLQAVITPELKENRYLIGITNAPPAREYDAGKSFRIGTFMTWKMSGLMLRFLKDMVTGNSPIPAKDAVGGPVQIVDVGNKLYQQGGLEGTFSFAAAMSLNLAILNFLPLPLLDGGQMLFVLIGVVRRKQLSRETEARIQGAFIWLFIGLALLITYNDIVRILTR